MIYSQEQIDNLKEYLSRIHKIIGKMDNEFGRHFTMDGHLLGSAGEMFASFYYGIELAKASTKTYDGKLDGKEIQIKITQGTSIEVKGIPEYLIVLKIEWPNDIIEIYEVYNGPGEMALQGRGENSNKERSISINKLSAIVVDKKASIKPRINSLKKWIKTTHRNKDKKA